MSHVGEGCFDFRGTGSDKRTRLEARPAFISTLALAYLRDVCAWRSRLRGRSRASDAGLLLPPPGRCVVEGADCQSARPRTIQLSKKYGKRRKAFLTQGKRVRWFVEWSYRPCVRHNVYMGFSLALPPLV